VFFLAGNLNAHISSCNFVLLFQQFNAFESLSFGGLVGFDGEVDFLDSLFDGVMGEPFFCGGVYAFLDDDVGDLSEQC
jgi:hypothetical protein